MFLKISGLDKAYGSKKILKNIDLTIDRGELISIVGPSGAGKTTLLKIIAGIENQDSGFLQFSDRKKNFSNPILVFQDYLLFPNMTVFENIAFGLRARKESKNTIISKTEEIMEYFNISDQKNLYPSQISAGQKQRTAIARALVLNPPMLLLDEPFANLDKELKNSTASFIKSTQQQFGITTVSVTHDLKEAFTISDKIAVMINGEILQHDTPYNIYRNPASVPVARLLGDINIVPAELLAGMTDHSLPYGKDVCIRPESILLTPAHDSTSHGIVERSHFSGHYWAVYVKYKGYELFSFSGNNNLKPGDRVNITVDEIIEFRE